MSNPYLGRFDIRLWIFIIFDVALSVTSVSDISLADNHAAHLIAYGQLWEALNPWYWTQQPYKLWLLYAQLSTLLLCYVAARKRRILWRTYWLAQWTQVLWWGTHWTENITVTAFSWLGAVNPAWALLEILQKLPVTISGIPSDRLQCALSCGPRYDWIHLATYGILAFWVLYPLTEWIVARRRADGPDIFESHGMIENTPSTSPAAPYDEPSRNAGPSFPRRVFRKIRKDSDAGRSRT